MRTEPIQATPLHGCRFGRATGSSLPETLAALALFAMSTATMGDFLVGQIRAAGSNGSHTSAYEIGIRELEELRSLPHDEIESRAAEVEMGGMLYVVSTRVEGDAAGPETKTIKVEVTWNEPGGTRHVVLETIDSAVTR